MRKLYPLVSHTYKLAVFSLTIFFILLQFFNVDGQTASFTTAGTATWICPAGVTNIQVESWGAGGSGGGVNTSGSFQGGGGGGGGAYTKVTNVPVTAGNTYNVTVGTGYTGTTGNGSDGGSSYFNINTAIANGGKGGSANNGVGGLGAAAGTSKGGDGFAGIAGIPGGGGSSAGPGGVGSNSIGIAGATAPTGGGNGGNGASTIPSDGNFGISPGGGGGGARKGNGAGTKIGGTGGTGLVILTYTCSAYILTGTSVNTTICKNTAATIVLTGTIPVGKYVVTYNTSAPNSQTGVTVAMNVTTAGTGSFNTANIPNSGNTTITITNLSSGSIGACSSTISSNNTATVNVLSGPPSALIYSTPTAIYCVGTTITNNSPSNSGGAAFMYSVIPALPGGLSIDPNTGIISGNPTTAAGVGSYTVTASNVCGSTTKAVSITVNSPASITTPPASQVKCPGDPVTFSVTASGTSPTFQWRKNGTNITGATSSTYTLASLAATDAGSYDVIVTVSSCGSIASAPATLIVNPLPTATISGNTSRCINSAQPDITFTGADGTAPYTFTYNINNGSTQTIATTSGNSVTMPVSTSAAGTYAYNLLSVKDVSSTACLQGQTGSATVTVTMLPTVNLLASPSPICQGASSVLTATSSGGTPVRSATNNTAQVISSVGTSTITSSIYIPAGVSISAADITLSITLKHAAAGNLTAILTSPCGGQSTIFNRPGGTNNGVSIDGTFIFNTSAATAFIANAAQSFGGTFNTTFGGITLPCSNADGIWTLSITDNANGNGGGLIGWSLSLSSNYTTTLTGPATIGAITYSDPNNATAMATVTPPVGISTYIATTTDAVGCSNNTSLSLTVNPNPTVTPGPAIATICQGGTTTPLRGSFGGGATGAVWSDGLSGATAGTFNNNAGNTLNTATYKVSATAPASITLTLTTIGGSCGTVSVTKMLTVNPNPTVDAGADIDAICQGASTGPLGGSFGGGAIKAIWSDNGAGGSFTNNGGLTPGTATYTASLTAPLSVKLTLTTSGGSCRTTSASKFLVINTLPTATISGTMGVCQNSPQPNVIFTGDNGNEPYTFTYTINNGPVQMVTTTSSASAAVSAPTDILGPFEYELISVQDASGCSQNQTGTALITVNPLPNPTLTGPNPICQGSTNLYSTETGQSNYVWTVVGGTKIAGGTSTDNTVTVTWTSMGAKSITVNYTNNFGCTAATSATIVNDPAAVNPTINGTSPVCLNSNNNYTTETGKSDYTWTVTGGTITGGGSVTSNNITITWDVITGTKKITLNYADGLGCSAASATVKNITVNPLPTATISGTTSVCQNSPQPNITFKGAGGTAPYTFTYTINSGSSQTITTVSGNTITLPAPTGTSGPFLYTLISVSDNSAASCSQNITGQSAMVTVNPLPSAIIAGATSICQNDPQPNIIFTGSGGTAPYTFTYTINGVTPALTVSTTSGNSVTVSVATGVSGSFTYNIVSVNDANTCTQNITGQSAAIVIKPSPVVVATPSNPGVCNVTSNVSIALTNPNSVPATTYSWSRNNTGTNLTGITGMGSGTPVAGTLVNTTTTTQSTTFTIIATSGNGCAGTITAMVSVYPSLVASVIGESQIICTGSAAAPLNGTTPAGGSGSFTYVWQQTADTIAGSWITAPSSTNSLTYSPPAQSRYYRLIATDALCGSTTSNIVQITKSADLGGSFNESGKPTSALCGESSFTYMVNSSSANAVFDDEDYYVRYTWQATPSGNVTGPPAAFGSNATCSVIIGYIGPFPIYYYFDCFPGAATFQVHNTTNSVVTVNIVVTPHVYNASGVLFCNLSPRTIPVTINPTPVITDKTTTACSGVGFTVSPQNGIPAGDVVPVSGTTYTWTAPVVSAGVTGGVAQPTGQSSVTGTLTNNSAIDKTATYTVTPSYGGCAGNTFKVIVTIRPTVTVATAMQVPPMCTGNAGIINLTGLVPGSTNTINYSINSVVQTPVSNVTADASGKATFNTRNLTAVDNGQVLSITGVDNSICTKAITTVTATLTVNPTLTWLGYNTDWTDISNWCGGIPLTTSNITIPVTGSGLYPVIPTGITATVHNINIAPGASIKLNGGTFQVSGSISNSGVFDASKGTVDMNGTALQTIIPNTFMNNAVLNLKITNTSASGVKLGGPLDLYGLLSFANGNNKLLNSGGYLNLRSVAAGTAMVTDVTNNGVNTNNRISGNVVVERYYPGRRAWRLVTAPVSTTRTIFNEWQVGGMPASVLPSSGTYITSPTGGNGLDVSLHFSLKKYNDTTGLLVDVMNTNVPISRNLQQFNIPDNIGYFMFVRGDRTPSLLSPYPITNYNITTLRDTGILQTGKKTFTAPNAGFMLVGNPYASPIDFSKLTRTSIPRKFWAWDPRLNNTLGAYVVVDGQVGNFIVTPGPDPVPLGSTGQDSIIQSSQAIFVQSTAALATLEFNENSKSVKDNNSVFRPAAPVNDPEISENMRTNLYLDDPDTAILADGIYVQFSKDFSPDVDQYDDVKFTNFLENFGIATGNKTLTLERRQPVTVADTIFFKLWNTTARKYQFRFSTSMLNHPGLEGYLVDNYMKKETKVDLNGYTNVNFSVTDDAGSKDDKRFMLVFRPVAAPLPLTFTSVKAYLQNSNINVEWNVANEINIKEYEVERSTDGTTFTRYATIIAKGNISSNIAYQWPDADINEGTYYYRIRSIGADGKAALSNTVKVTIEKGIPRIFVYPNPVIAGDNINIHFINQPKGRFNIRLLDKIGQLIIARQVEITGDNSVQKLPFNKSLAHANYQVEITRPDGSKIIIAVLY